MNLSEPNVQPELNLVHLFVDVQRRDAEWVEQALLFPVAVQLNFTARVPKKQERHIRQTPTNAEIAYIQNQLRLSNPNA